MHGVQFKMHYWAIVVKRLRVRAVDFTTDYMIARKITCSRGSSISNF